MTSTCRTCGGAITPYHSMESNGLVLSTWIHTLPGKNHTAYPLGVHKLADRLELVLYA